MTISKKLFLLTTLVVGFQANMSANQYLTADDIKKQEIFKFALALKQQDNADAKMASEFIEYELLGFDNKWFYNHDKIIAILNAQLTLQEKRAYILQIKTTQNEAIAQNKIDEENRQKQYDKQQRQYRIDRIKEALTIGAVMTAAVAVLPGLSIVSETIGKHVGPKIVTALFTA